MIDDANSGNTTARLLLTKWEEYHLHEGRIINETSFTYESFFLNMNLLFSGILPIVFWFVSLGGALVSAAVFFARRKESQSARLLVIDFVNDSLAALLCIRFMVSDILYDQAAFENSYFLTWQFAYTCLFPANVFLKCSTYLSFSNVLIDVFQLIRPSLAHRTTQFELYFLTVVIYVIGIVQRLPYFYYIITLWFLHKI